MGTFQPTSFVLKDGRNLTVRSVQADDAAACVDYVRAVLPECTFMVTQASEWNKTVVEERAWLQQKIDDAGAVALLAVCAGQIVGFSDVSSRQGRAVLRHAATLSISVRLAFRGLGVGKTLMQCVIQWAEDHPDLERLTLAVMAPNKPALALYQQLGFVEEGYCAGAFKQPDGQYLDDVLMVRWLKSPVAPSATTSAVPPLIQPTLTIGRLIVRAPILADADELQKKIGDRAIADTTENIPYPYGDGEAKKWIARQAGQFARGESASFVILLRSTGELIGGLGITDISARDSQAELGYWIAVPHWGKGYCTEAAAAVLRYAFNDRKLARVYAHHLVRNPASGRVMRKLGMKPEGTLRQHIVKWGKREDVALYGLLKDEWCG